MLFNTILFSLCARVPLSDHTLTHPGFSIFSSFFQHSNTYIFRIRSQLVRTFVARRQWERLLGTSDISDCQHSALHNRLRDFHSAHHPGRFLFLMHYCLLCATPSSATTYMYYSLASFSIHNTRHTNTDSFLKQLTCYGQGLFKSLSPRRNWIDFTMGGGTNIVLNSILNQSFNIYR